MVKRKRRVGEVCMYASGVEGHREMNDGEGGGEADEVAKSAARG